jgi:hypothetical protein
MENRPAYGTTRERQANVSYLEIERAALEVLAEGRRPSVEIIRKRLARGSPATIAAALKRFWKELGIRAAGAPAALTRLPVEIADLADGLWQKALALASQSATQDDNAARERLKQLQFENEVRAQSFAMRERELDSASREREQALIEARSQISALMKELVLDRETMRAQLGRIVTLNAQVDDSRQQLVTVVTRALARHKASGNSIRKRSLHLKKPLNKIHARKRKLARKPK